MTEPLVVHAANRQCPSDYDTLIWFTLYWFFVLRVSIILLVLTECKKISPILEADAIISP